MIKDLLKNNKVLLIIILAILVIIIGGCLFYFTGIGAASSGDNQQITVEVKEGSTGYDILNSLDEAGLINNYFCAKIYFKILSPDQLQANTYLLTKDMSLPDMVEIIKTGKFDYILKSQFTIIDGGTYRDAAESISENLDIKKEEIIAKWSDTSYLKKLIDKYWFLTDDILNDKIDCPLEGFLYPETYFVTDKNPSIETITTQILDTTESKLEGNKDAILSGDMSVFDLINFASIVETEALFDEDKAKIAGVFINRLNDGMKLQSCSTVLYALGVKHINVSYADLTVESPYNTYKYAGLPPGPISNPSIDTIEKSLNYEKNDYLFFFAKEDGHVIYSKTYEEHEKAIDENQWY